MWQDECFDLLHTLYTFLIFLLAFFVKSKLLFKQEVDVMLKTRKVKVGSIDLYWFQRLKKLNRLMTQNADDIIPTCPFG